jgi:hypothetical protein
MPKAQQSRVNMYVKLSSKTGLSASALSKDVFQNKPWTKSASGHLPKTKNFFFSSKASIKQWQGRRVLGCKKKRSRPLQNQQATSGKKENFDEQCQSKLQH